MMLIVAASCGFFMTQYGVIIDESMIRNAVETTVLEATPLLSGAYYSHLVVYGVLPAAVVFLVPLPRLPWRTELQRRRRASRRSSCSSWAKRRARIASR
jgi:lipid A ethanolaminephosphotransferase